MPARDCANSFRCTGNCDELLLLLTCNSVMGDSQP
jgi:hypothetical protein